jgi:hypothetical protein
MIVESCQLICTTLNLHNLATPYKSSHINHPSRLWLEQVQQNIYWVLQHCKQLLDLYEKQSGKIHKCSAIWQHCKDVMPRLDIPDTVLTLPYLAMKIAPDLLSKHATSHQNGKQQLWQAKTLEDAVEAYRAYMIRKDYWLPEYSFKN